MIIRKINTNKLYNTKYLDICDRYLILDGDKIIQILKPAEFRYLLYDKKKEYTIEESK